MLANSRLLGTTEAKWFAKNKCKKFAVLHRKKEQKKHNSCLVT